MSLIVTPSNTYWTGRSYSYRNHSRRTAKTSLSSSLVTKWTWWKNKRSAASRARGSVSKTVTWCSSSQARKITSMSRALSTSLEQGPSRAKWRLHLCQRGSPLVTFRTRLRCSSKQRKNISKINKTASAEREEQINWLANNRLSLLDRE